MNDDSFRKIPAAIPAVVFCCGIGLARVAVHPVAAAAASILIALLIAAAPRFRAAGAAMSFLALGVAIGAVREGRIAREDLALADVREERFATVVAPVERPWRRAGDASILRARSFVLGTGAHAQIARPITITIWDDAPDLGRASELLAEGFLRCDAERCSMSVKSAELTTLSGEVARWNPAAWNRAAYRRLSRLAFAERPPSHPEAGEHARHYTGGTSSPVRRGAAQAAALALGRGEMLDPEVREAYRRGGTYHLLVFSGMQIAFAAGAIAFGFRRFGRPRLTDGILIAMAIVAPPFAGHDPSVSRSALMIGLYAAARLIRRPTSVQNLLFVSAIVRLILVPDELTEPGFVLTYAATGGLVVLGRRLAAAARRPLTRGLLFGIGAELGTAPVTAFFFHHVIVASSVVTLLLSPVLTLMLGLSAIACMLAFLSDRVALLLLEAIGRLDQLAVLVNEGIADQVGTARFVAAPPGAIVALALGTAVLFATSRRRGAVPLAVLSLLAPILSSLAFERTRSSVPDFQIEMLDVGQGEALLIRQGRHAVLVDGGGRRDDSSSFARAVLIPNLIDRGVRRIDAIVLTHPDPDHCGALPDLIRALHVAEVWISSRHLREPCAANLVERAIARGIPLVLPDRRRARRVGPFEIRTFAATPPFRRSLSNNTSVVLAVSGGGRDLLLTGDIERAAEFQLLAERPDLAESAVLKVAHHGSRTSTSEALLEAARPRIALISAGFRNSYGHPAQETLERLRVRGIRIYRTDQSGTIRLVVRNGQIFPSVEIDTIRRAGTL